MTALEDALWNQIVYAGLELPERQFRFHPSRRWRFDFAWAERPRLLAVEVDGGLYVYGGHNRGAQIEKDMEKAAEAICMGWTVLRVSGRHVKSGQALEWIERALHERSS